jgi:hypothetical protein
MSKQAETRILPELARQIASEGVNTFKIAIVSSGHQAGILTSILAKNLRIPKQRITQLGYTASDEQNASLLRKQNSIVIVPEPIITHRPCHFYPHRDANEVVVFKASGEKVEVSRHSCSGQPFYLDEVLSDSKVRTFGERGDRPNEVEAGRTSSQDAALKLKCNSVSSIFEKSLQPLVLRRPDAWKIRQTVDCEECAQKVELVVFGKHNLLTKRLALLSGALIFTTFLYLFFTDSIGLRIEDRNLGRMVAALSVLLIPLTIGLLVNALAGPPTGLRPVKLTYPSAKDHTLYGADGKKWG